MNARVKTVLLTAAAAVAVIAALRMVPQTRTFIDGALGTGTAKKKAK
jgi:hypothetical protein